MGRLRGSADGQDRRGPHTAADLDQRALQGARVGVPSHWAGRLGRPAGMSCRGTSVRIDDCSLWVVERGPADGLPLILLHGGPGLDHHEFADYLDPVCDDGVRLLLVDQRAQGRSEPTPPGTWTLERMAQDVIMLALALKLPRYAVLGHSYGAFVALQNAVDYPGQALATVVSGGVASVPTSKVSRAHSRRSSPSSCASRS